MGHQLNGQHQPICTFPGQGATRPQRSLRKGWADSEKWITFASYPARLRKLTDRTPGRFKLAESGGDFLDVFQFLSRAGLLQGKIVYTQCQRVFRRSSSQWFFAVHQGSGLF